MVCPQDEYGYGARTSRVSCSPGKFAFCVSIFVIFFVSHCSGTIRLARASYTNEDCAIKRQSDTKSKHLYIEDKEYPVTLLSSRRIPHQLLTKVVATFLQKYIGYEEVQIIYDEAIFAEDVLTAIGYGTDQSYVDNFVPKALASLEVWVPPGYSNDDFSPFDSDSYLGLGGRFGWFFESRLIEEYGVLDHWRAFNMAESPTVRMFSRNPQELRSLMPLMQDPENNSYYCTHSSCRQGIFTPSHCISARCAVLFSSYFNTSYFLIDQIEEMHLYVSVVWIGPHLDAAFIQRNTNISGSRSGLFFHWTPDVTLQPFILTSVSFPACTDHIFNLDTSEPTLFCRYETFAFHKFVWRGLKAVDRYLYQTLERISLDSNDYLGLIDEYMRHPDFTLDQVVCSWMSNNKETWEFWRNLQPKASLYFVGLFPLKGSTLPDNRIKFVAPGNLPAFTLAIDAVNRNKSVLPDYHIKAMVVNTACEPDIVMHEFIKIIKFTTEDGTFNKIIGVVGPACSDTVEPLVGVSKFIKMPVISYGAEGAIFADRNQYPYFYRTIPENKIFKYVFLQLFNRLEWTRIASLTEDGHQYSDYLIPLQDLLQTKKITFHARKYPQQRETESMEQYLLSLKNNRFRIIIGDFYQDIARRVMCEALKLKMTSQEGYVWFLPRWYSDDWYDMSKVNSSHEKCTTEEMARALDGHLSLSYKYFASDNTVTHENMTVKEWKQNYGDEAQKFGVPVSDYAGFTYDATWAYALALNKLFHEEHSFTSNLRSNKTMKRFTYYLDETNFDGVSGPVNFTHGTSRLTDIVVWQFNKTYREVARFYPDSSHPDWGTLTLNKHLLKFPLGEIPSDGSIKCGVEGFRKLFGDAASCSTAIIVLCAIPLIVLIIILISVFFLWRHRYNKRLKHMEEMWRNQSIYKKFEGWEIARSKVVINRKLGEGQFGTVYGGECLRDDEGWVAVAVKTLKIRATISEKLDFLFEAEVMKNFNHANVVKLLGVCTENEPVYTVMEFMLYGDLKTYLLSRRSLVNEKWRNDEDEVSNRRLTSMALDVAKALHYLASTKYVHRDVACRNCLVNACRSVKLADFGMTRPLNENNYYRFSRKGLLPVRWMAVESLREGVFTSMSDIWSYGVLLYEIITFGSVPYQGWSNNEVFEKVRCGQTLPIPAGVKPQLEFILRSCWNAEPLQRPSPEVLTRYLSTDPCLIAPCLEDPMWCSEPAEGASVSLDMRGSERFRRLSLSAASTRQQQNSTSSQSTSVHQNAEVNRKRTMSGNTLHSLTWEDRNASVIDALNLNGAVKCSSAKISALSKGGYHLTAYPEQEERETLIKNNTVVGVTSDFL